MARGSDTNAGVIDGGLINGGLINGGLGSRRLVTSRLALRWVAPDDAAALAQYASEPLILQKTDTIPHPHDETTAHHWIAQSDALRLQGAAYRFAVTDRVLGHFIGIAALGMAADGEDAAELAYWLGRPFWDKGYGGEAVAALIAFGRDILRLKSVEAVVYAENTASVAVLGRQGFVEAEFDLLDVPERGGNRLVRRFTLELTQPTTHDDLASSGSASAPEPGSKSRIAG